MLDNQQELQKYIHTIIEIWKSNGEIAAAQVLTNATNINAHQAHYDNWDGGQYYFSIDIRVSVAVFKEIEFKIDSLKEKFSETLILLLQSDKNLHISDISILPEIAIINKITSDTRLAIFEILSKYPIGDIDFLGSIYDLKKFPSKDTRYITFYEDIWKHTVDNYDWEDNWWRSDNRLNLIACSDAEFSKFLGAVIKWFIKPMDINDDSLKAINKELSYDNFIILNISPESKRANFAIKEKVASTEFTLQSSYH